MKVNSKMVNLNSQMSVILLNINQLNISIGRQNFQTKKPNKNSLSFVAYKKLVLNMGFQKC